MICLWISIVIGFVNDFVIERFGKERAGVWARSGLRDFFFGKIALVPGREVVSCWDKWTKHICPGCSIPVGKPG